MLYQCQDCSYRGKQRNELGQCPACGSYNYRRQGASKTGEGTKGSSPLKLLTLVALWAVFITQIYWKLQQ
jgi:predicted ATP-dependent serine protease